MNLDLKIRHGATFQQPSVVNGVTIEWERKGQPGKMNFSVVKTAALSFSEGDSVSFAVDGKRLFQGFVFSKERTGLDKKIIKVSCFDQLYYMSKNQDTYVIENKTASDVLRMIGDDFGLKLGLVTSTPYLMESRVEDNNQLLDIMQTSLDLTEEATGMTYTLFDDAGLLALLPDAALTISDAMINADSAGDFSYKTSISEDTYNRIKLIQENSDSGERKVFLAQDPAKMAKWGVLQYTEKLDSDESGGQMKANALLKQYNMRKRSLSIKEVKGDVRVRGGTILPVMLGLGDMNLMAMMRVEQVQHTFYENEHKMSLRLSGGDFVG